MSADPVPAGDARLPVADLALLRRGPAPGPIPLAMPMPAVGTTRSRMGIS